MKISYLFVLIFLCFASCKDYVDGNDTWLNNGKICYAGTDEAFTGKERSYYDIDNGSPYQAGGLSGYSEEQNGIPVGEFADYDRIGILIMQGRFLSENEKGPFIKELIAKTGSERIDVCFANKGALKYRMQIEMVSKEPIKRENLGKYILQNFRTMKFKGVDSVKGIQVYWKYNKYNDLLMLYPGATERDSIQNDE